MSVILFVNANHFAMLDCLQRFHRTRKKRFQTGIAVSFGGEDKNGDV
jgi:hypothetical protein